ncbi:uncharacterized protein LOC119109415 [Pollicipes pollicipes]|uniref:uncharacterized protein LOC119109415 n=1 Tax=Pollicipes pollicipes TaxID=41117 RepID=UPI001884BB87|nr:uncharacterized protein LOC119109415 [Pollicipes pollicipes]
MVITRENFLEDLLRIAQMEQRGNRSHREVEPFVDAFQSRFTRELRIGSNSSVLPSTGARRVLAPAAWYLSVSGALQRLYPGVSFADPRRVLFLGELNVWLDVASASVRGLRSPAAAAATSAADNAAYLLTVSATGERGPAMLVTPSSGLVRDDMDPAESCFRQTTRNGNITPAALLVYVAKVLDSHLMTRQVARPVLLYVDGLTAASWW